MEQGLRSNFVTSSSNIFNSTQSQETSSRKLKLQVVDQPISAGTSSSLCSHLNISPDGTCMHCGKTLTIFHNGYSECGHTTSKSEKSIMPDMDHIPVTEDIKVEADRIFQVSNCGTHRGHKRKNLVFDCLYKAHKSLGVNVDPYSLACKVGISKGEITKSRSMFSQSQTGYIDNDTTTYAWHLLPDYCRDANLSEDAIEEIVEMTKQIINDDCELKEKTPRTVAAGMLKYYTAINGINISMTGLTQITKLSEATIMNMYKYIARIHNS